MSAAVEWLPNEPLFHHVLEYFTANPDLVFLNDSVKSTKATYSELLVDMILMRHQIIQSLPSSMLDARQMIIPERPFFLIIAPGNYDFIVAAFSILCCGAAFSSLRKHIRTLTHAKTWINEQTKVLTDHDGV